MAQDRTFPLNLRNCPFETDEDALDVLYQYGHEEHGNGFIRGEWKSFNDDCRAAVQYLCDEWDFEFVETGDVN